MENVNIMIGKKIKELRKEAGLTQTEFGEKFHLSQNDVTNIENGKKTVSYEVLIDISDYFKVTTDYLIKKSGVKENNPTKQYICDYLGLSEATVDMLRQFKDFILIPTNMEVMNYISFDYAHVTEGVLEYSKNALDDFLQSIDFKKIITYLSMLLTLKKAIANIKFITEKYDNIKKVKNSDLSNLIKPRDYDYLYRGLSETLENCEREQKLNKYEILNIVNRYLENYDFSDIEQDYIDEQKQLKGTLETFFNCYYDESKLRFVVPNDDEMQNKTQNNIKPPKQTNEGDDNAE